MRNGILTCAFRLSESGRDQTTFADDCFLKPVILCGCNNPAENDPEKTLRNWTSYSEKRVQSGNSETHHDHRATRGRTVRELDRFMEYGISQDSG
jgi:hypothetical protein